MEKILQQIENDIAYCFRGQSINQRQGNIYTITSVNRAAGKEIFSCFRTDVASKQYGFTHSPQAAQADLRNLHAQHMAEMFSVEGRPCYGEKFYIPSAVDKHDGLYRLEYLGGSGNHIAKFLIKINKNYLCLSLSISEARILCINHYTCPRVFTTGYENFPITRQQIVDLHRQQNQATALLTKLAMEGEQVDRLIFQASHKASKAIFKHVLGKEDTDYLLDELKNSAKGSALLRQAYIYENNHRFGRN